MVLPEEEQAVAAVATAATVAATAIRRRPVGLDEVRVGDMHLHGEKLRVIEELRRNKDLWFSIEVRITYLERQSELGIGETRKALERYRKPYRTWALAKTAAEKDAHDGPRRSAGPCWWRTHSPS
ncbi:hypothetical protein AB0M11_28700 [Streptomyces sp. NPDC051987]|uniref:hypothetical protein n=1 Tax=Streptomyces sp. NPDC051987 TaxID=3155808 RepID=UPI00342D323B